MEPKTLEKQLLQSPGTVSYEERKTYFDSISIRKSILLCQYTKLLMEWINDTQSLDDTLMINEKHKQRFTKFLKHFQNEMVICNDDSLKRELDVLQKLTN